MQNGLVFFKAAMFVEGSLLGALLAAIRITFNWLLDFAALLSFTHQTVPRYFMEIGLRHLVVAATTAAVGYVV